MHHLVDAVLAYGAYAWLRFGRYRWSRLRRGLFERRYRDTPLPDPRRIEEVAQVLAQVTWTPDGLLHLYDAVSRPGTTWAKRRDDCDGFAALVAELLRRLDRAHAPVLVSAVLRPLRRSHTVCAFHEPSTGDLRAFDNARLRPERFASTAEVAGYLARRGHRALCWDAVSPSDLRVLEAHRFQRPLVPS
ncbi:MAG: hypothetical protein GEU80_12890 [Dehalococcoidia bacterium]|nr:hypothetical protein [Dehalococcoidia bacterium]